MIAGLGFDLVSVARISTLLATDDAFERRVFTRGERDACVERVDRAQALAARFAAKEACLKALGTGWGPGISFVEVEVVSAAPRSLRRLTAGSSPAGVQADRTLSVLLVGVPGGVSDSPSV